MKTKQLKLLKLVTPLALAALLIPAISSGFPTDTDTYQVNAGRVAPFTFADPGGPANNASHQDWVDATATDVPLAYIIFASANAEGGFDSWAEVSPAATRNLIVKSVPTAGTYCSGSNMRMRPSTRTQGMCRVSSMPSRF